MSDVVQRVEQTLRDQPDANIIVIHVSDVYELLAGYREPLNRKALVERAKAEFTKWFVKNYPGPDTIIGDPEWHAPRIFRSARLAIEAGMPEQEPTGVQDAFANGYAYGMDHRPDETFEAGWSRAWHNHVERALMRGDAVMAEGGGDG